jgi:hypothetical protein
MNFNGLTLQEAVKELVEGPALNEGFFSQYFTGVDEDELTRLEARLRAGYTTEEDKKRDLDAIDDLVDNAMRIFTTSDIKKVLTKAGGTVLLGGLNNVIYVLLRATGTKDRKEFRSALYTLHAKIKAAPVKPAKK